MMATAPIEEVAVVKHILANLREYLREHLYVDADLISSLRSKRMLAEDRASQLNALVKGGGCAAVDDLLGYMSSFYDGKTLEKFCSFLDESSQSAKPLYGIIAQRIRGELEKLQPTPTPPAQTERDVDSQPAPRDLLSSPPTTQGESTSAVSTGDERSQKIEEIVEIYRNNNKVCLPRFKQLEDDFETVMGQLASKLNQSSADLIIKLHTIIRMKYRRYIHGVQAAPLPDVPVTAGGLLDFIAEKSNALEILLVHRAVDVLECKDLKDALEKYEGKLAKHLETELLSFKSRGVALPSRKEYTHMAIGLRKEKDQVFLSLVIHIKEYLMEILHLEEALFEGFAGGCTVLFFSILRIDAVLLSPKVISHLPELKRKFEIAHLVVFGYFACDLEQASVEILNPERRIGQLTTALEKKERELQIWKGTAERREEMLLESRSNYSDLEREHEELRNNKEKEIESLQNELETSQTRLDRMSKENSELRLLVEKKGQNKNEPNVENRMSTSTEEEMKEKRSKRESMMMKERSKSMMEERMMMEMSRMREREEMKRERSKREREMMMEMSRMMREREEMKRERSKREREEMMMSMMRERESMMERMEMMREEEMRKMDRVERGYYEPRELNQVDADKELKEKATNGEHLVWKEGEGNLTLGIWQDGRCYHLQIHQKQSEASRASYSLDEKVYFDSIRQLCNHYKEEPLPGYSFKLCQ